MKRPDFDVRQKVAQPALVEKFLDELIADVPGDGEQLEKRKRAFAAENGGTTIITRDVIAVALQRGDVLPENLEKLLQKRAVRTISGVTPIGILTKPWPCPGQCVYCPTEARMPKSYLSSQPAAARALRNKFHPFDQVKNRIVAVEDSGHPVSKLEVIVMGGTWSALTDWYQSWYVKNIFDAANGTKSRTLTEAQKANETADRRVIGLTLETRPDWITEKEILKMRKYGCTRVELGVQTLDDDVQRLTKRGHTHEHVARAMRLLRDAGFKVCWHLMPGLPGSSVDRDLEWMEKVWSDVDCRPDFVKIYPCQVLPNSELEGWWRDGKFEPLRDANLVPLLLNWKKSVPEYARVMRLMRDIPVGDVLDGVKFSNLRQILKTQPEKVRELLAASDVPDFEVPEDWPCRCVRCREVGFSKKNTGAPELVRRTYESAGGTEEFLSFESADRQTIFALLRLRRPGGTKFSKMGSVLHSAALVREVHSYGSEVSVGDEAGSGQHRGLGKKLLLEAERIARDEWKLKKITIIAGVGTREYYRKFGYELRVTYMTKKLK